MFLSYGFKNFGRKFSYLTSYSNMKKLSNSRFSQSDFYRGKCLGSRVMALSWFNPFCLICLVGRFGNGVSSFFVFLKSLLFLNILTFILEFGLVTLPSVIIENNVTSRANTNSCYFDDSSSSTVQYSSDALSIANKVADFISGKVRSYPQ